jgi:hypothetical protein
VRICKAPGPIANRVPASGVLLSVASFDDGAVAVCEDVLS